MEKPPQPKWWFFPRLWQAVSFKTVRQSRGKNHHVKNHHLAWWFFPRLWRPVFRFRGGFSPGHPLWYQGFTAVRTETLRIPSLTSLAQASLAISPQISAAGSGQNDRHSTPKKTKGIVLASQSKRGRGASLALPAARRWQHPRAVVTSEERALPSVWLC